MMKKKVTLLVMLLLLSMGIMAQSVSFLDDGKKWNYYWNAYRSYAYYYSSFIAGDSIINGKICKKIYNQQEGEEAKFQAVLYEEAGRVYRVSGKEAELELLYDFTLKEGDSICQHTSDYDYEYKVKEVSTIESKGHTYNRMLLEAVFNPNRYVVWVEGIGSENGLLNNDLEQLYGEYSILLGCEANGETIYCTHEFKAPLLVDGKTWTYRMGDDVSGYQYMQQVVDGDTLIGSQTWKKVYMENPVGSMRYYQKAMREDSLTIYELMNNDDEEQLFLDFGVRYYSQFFKDDTKAYYAEVVPLGETTSFCGIVRQQVILVQYKTGESMPMPNGESSWTEAIGGDCGIYKAIVWKMDEEDLPWELFTCYEGENCIYMHPDAVQSDMNYYLVNKITTSPISSSIFDLQGRRLSGKPEKGMYIQDGKKKVVK